MAFIKKERLKELEVTSTLYKYNQDVISYNHNKIKELKLENEELKNQVERLKNWNRELMKELEKGEI